MFYLVSQLRGTCWCVVVRILEEQRHVLAGVLDAANMFDQNLLPLAQTPAVVNN